MSKEGKCPLCDRSLKDRYDETKAKLLKLDFKEPDFRLVETLLFDLIVTSPTDGLKAEIDGLRSTLAQEKAISDARLKEIVALQAQVKLK